MFWEIECYYPSFYYFFDIDQVSQRGGEIFIIIGVNDIHLNVQVSGGHNHEIVLRRVLYYLILFTNLISASCLQKKGMYLYRGTETLKSCNDIFQLAFTPIKNGLYVL